MRKAWAVGGLLLLAGAAGAQEGVLLKERFPVGYTYHVSTRVELEGTLSPPAPAGKAPRPVSLKGDSAVEYDERIQEVSPGGTVSKTVRICRRMDFRRTVADQLQETSLRPAVRRLVLLRHSNTEVPFSPDGPLMWGEIDQVRTDVFTPALAGLLPDRAVRVGERWKASEGAVRELTDMESIEEGGLECKLERVEETRKGRQARVSFTGVVRGTNEDGPNRQKLTGQLTFDLASAALSGLQLQGVHSMLDKDGKEVGRIEGRFILTRERNDRCEELSERALKGLATEPSADNTRLLYDNPDMGVRFLYPRRWRVVGAGGSQVMLDGSDGSGLVLTLDPPDKAVTAAQFLAESKGWLQRQKGKLLRTVAPERVRPTPPLDRFALEAELNGQKVWIDYYVTLQAGGGVTLAARLPPRDLEALRKEADVLARSITITRTIRAPAPKK